MNEDLKIWLKAIPEGWKIFGAVSGFVVLVSSIAIKIDHWKDKGLDQANIIEYLQKSDHNQDRYNQMKDSLDYIKWQKLDNRLKFISDSIRLAINNQQTLTNAVGTIGSRMTNTIPELFELMGGLQFEFVQSEVMKSIFPETKIKIYKKDTIKK